VIRIVFMGGSVVFVIGRGFKPQAASRKPQAQSLKLEA